MLNYLKGTLFISVVCIGLCIENAKGMFGVHDTVFDLPVGTNGLQSLQQKRKICGTDKDCVHVIVNGDNIYFPADGTQPTTIEAGICSCANVNIDSITDWYVRAFGGDDAVEWSKNNDPKNTDSAPKLGFEKLCIPTEETKAPVKLTVTTLNAQTVERHVITVEGDATFKKAFWTTFRIIASNPVGRVLLYRLLIEMLNY